VIPLRVLRVLEPRVAGTNLSGPAALIPWLAGRGHAVAVLALGDGPAVAPAAVLAARQGWWRWWRQDREAAVRAAATWGADLVHVHGEAALATGIEIARCIAAPLVADPWTLLQPGTARQLRDPAVSAVVLPSEEHRSRILAHDRLTRDRVAVVPPGVGGLMPPPRPADGSLVISVRLGAGRRGQAVLVDAVAMLRGDGLAVSAVVSGGARELRLLGEAVRNRRQDPAVFVASLPAAGLAAADVAVVVDSGDVDLHPVVDALAAGRPVVASADGAMPEVVDDGNDGILVPPGDAASLAGALRMLAAADRRSAMSAQALISARRFGVDLVGEAVLAAYRSAVGGGPAGGTATWRRLTSSRLRRPRTVGLDAAGTPASSKLTP
jgi:glycosyltransferase involved in cell wall biosynthesis